MTDDRENSGGTSISDQDLKKEVEETARELAEKVNKTGDQKSDQAPETGEETPRFSEEELKKTFYLNEYGDADITIQLFQNRFVRDNSTGDYYKYNEHRWHRCLNREQEAEFREVADVYSQAAATCAAQEKKAAAEENKEEQKRQKAWKINFNGRAKSLRGSSRIKNVLSLATAGAGSLGMSGDGWNDNHRLLPVANGVVDLETGKLRDGRYDDWFSCGSPVKYEGFKYHGEFVPDFLNKLLCGNEDLIKYTEYLLGFACTGIQTKDFFVAFGPLGNNGKSVLMDWVSRVLGEFAATVPVEMIYEDRFGRDPDKPSPQILRFRGLRMAIMAEPASNKRLSPAKVKYLTSGTDQIGGRNLNEKELLSFWPSHTLIMHGNEVPRVIGHQKAFYDRLKLLPFRARFVRSDDEVDEDNHVYKQIPRAEMDALLREHDSELLSFLVRCAHKALHLGDMPSPPREVIEETKAFRDEEDLVGHYLRQCTEIKRGVENQAKAVYESFYYFCKEGLGLSAKQIPSQKAISSDLRAQAHIERVEKRTIMYSGIELKGEWVPEEEWVKKHLK